MCTNLYFFRHGIAEDDYEKPDFYRTLTSEGKEAVMLQAIALHQAGIRPDRLFSSPYVRARETAEILGRYWEMPVEIWDGLGCGAMLDDVVELIDVHEHPASVMVVGHQPDFSDMIYTLTGKDVTVQKGSMIHVYVKRFGLLGATIEQIKEPVEVFV